MKIINYIMSFAAVCAFTACSNDEPATPAAQAPDATLSRFKTIRRN
jgi:hypothetical protein